MFSCLKSCQSCIPGQNPVSLIDMPIGPHLCSIMQDVADVVRGEVSVQDCAPIG